MKINRKLLCWSAASFIAFSCFSSCSKSEEKSIEDSEAATAMMTAQQLEQAKIEGRNAAKPIVVRSWGPGDSLQLQEAILDARIISLKYEKEGNPKLKETFDSAFFGTIRTVYPEIADQLHPEIQPKEKQPEL